MAKTSSFLLTLVRHGQTEANRNLIIQGHMNVCLSDEGRLQAKKLSDHIQRLNINFNTVYCSDLSRALETAQIILMHDDPSRIVVDDRLRERSYGCLEGKTLQDLRDAAKSAGFNDKNYSSFVPEGAESLAQVRLRIQDFCLNELPSACDASTSNVLLVTHGGVIREFMRFFQDSLKCPLAGLREPLRVTPNTGVNVFRLMYLTNPKTNVKSLVRAECIRVHDVSHLADDQDARVNTLHQTVALSNTPFVIDHLPSVETSTEVAPVLEAL